MSFGNGRKAELGWTGGPGGRGGGVESFFGR